MSLRSPTENEMQILQLRCPSSPFGKGEPRGICFDAQENPPYPPLSKGGRNALISKEDTKSTKKRILAQRTQRAQRNHRDIVTWRAWREKCSLRALRALRGGVLVGLLVLLAGCTLGPNYQRPGVLTPDSYRFGNGGPAGNESLADLPWWELFKDPVLQELIRTGLTNNYDLRTAVARVEEARAQIGVTRSFLYPQINFNSGGTTEQVSNLKQ